MEIYLSIFLNLAAVFYWHVLESSFHFLGFGDVVPKTSIGKIFYISCSAATIPLMMTLLKSTAEMITIVNRKFFIIFNKYLCKKKKLVSINWLFWIFFGGADPLWGEEFFLGGVDHLGKISIFGVNFISDLYIKTMHNFTICLLSVTYFFNFYTFLYQIGVICY